MQGHMRGARAPAPRLKSVSSTDREATWRRMARKGFAVLRNNPDGSRDFYRLLGFAPGDVGLRAWCADGEDLVGYAVVGFASIVVSIENLGGAHVLWPDIAPVVLLDGQPELARSIAGYLGLAMTEEQALRLPGAPRRKP